MAGDTVATRRGKPSSLGGDVCGRVEVDIHAVLLDSCDQRRVERFVTAAAASAVSRYLGTQMSGEPWDERGLAVVCSRGCVPRCLHSPDRFITIIIIITFSSVLEAQLPQYGTRGSGFQSDLRLPRAVTTYRRVADKRW